MNLEINFELIQYFFQTKFEIERYGCGNPFLYLQKTSHEIIAIIGSLFASENQSDVG